MRVFVTILIVSHIIFISVVAAQKHQDLFNFYTNKQIQELESRVQELENLKLADPEILFFKTVLSDNGDNAVAVYEKLHKESKGSLKNLTAQKLAEYYYARGFYVRSSEYKKIAKTYIPVKTTEYSNSGDNTSEYKTERQQTSIYKIQVGAFGVKENAIDLAEYLKKKKLTVNVVNREVDGTTLHCVWVEGRSSLEDTEEMAKEIKRKYRLSYRILKP